MIVDVFYYKNTDSYVIDDGSEFVYIDVPAIEEFLQIIKETHPELLENIKSKE
jgi:hypothetical protein